MKKMKKFLAMGITAAFLAATLTACGSTSSSTTTTSDDSADETEAADEAVSDGESKGTVTLLSWGGTIETAFYEDGMAEKFKEETGYDFVLVSKSDSSAIISQALAQADNPEVDVVLCDAASFMEGVNAGIFDDIAEEDVPNLENCIDQCYHGNYVYTYFTVSGLLYDIDDYEANGWDIPTSYEDMFADELCGRVAFDHFPSSYSDAPMMIWSEAAGGSYDDMDAAFEKLAELAPNVYEYIPSISTMAEWFANDEISLASYCYDGVATAQNAGVNVGFVIPEEGTYLMPTACGIMKDAPNSEGARALVNFLLSEGYLTLRYEKYNNLPSNQLVELAEDSPVTWDVINAAKVFDYDAISEYRPGWVERFDSEIAEIPKAF